MQLTEQEKEKIISQFLPKIKHYALKYCHLVNDVLEVKDLISAGVCGLLEALERYDCSTGVPLAVFVDYRIRGSILDEVRSLDVFSKEFRSKIDKVKQILSSQSENVLTDEEIAQQAGISVEDLHKIYARIRASNIISLDQCIEVDGDKLNILDILAGHDDIFQNVQLQELRTYLAQAIESLSQQEKIIISLYYYEDLNMKEIAKILNITPSRASQIHGKALLKLRKFLEKVYMNQ